MIAGALVLVLKREKWSIQRVWKRAEREVEDERDIYRKDKQFIIIAYLWIECLYTKAEHVLHIC